MNSKPEAIVIGGGISGLACCHRLRELGVEAILLESGPRAGGVIGSVESDGRLFEKGPQSFLLTDTLRRFAGRLGLAGEIIEADARAPRYILRNAALQMVPLGPQALLTSSLLGARSKWRLATEPLRKWRAAPAEESVAAFVRRKFGSEILDYLVAPFISGIYAGDAEELSFQSAFPSMAQWEREYGSVLRGAIHSGGKGTRRPALASFRGGMENLPAAIAAKLGDAFQAQAAAQSVRRTGDSNKNQFEIRLNRTDGPCDSFARTIVFASPSYVTATLIEEIAPEAARGLAQIPYAPVAVIASAYFRRQVEHPLAGFGFLVPRIEGLATLGTVWNSSLFPGRARDGQVVLTSFAGGATDLSLMKQTPEEIGDLVGKEMARILGITGPVIEQRVWCHSRALPQYNIGHGERLARIQEGLRAAPGIFLAGNYLEGPAIGNCVEHAFRTAENVLKYLRA
jgi:protoporphyrinogen/coproporphyrinogen III oxidase